MRGVGVKDHRDLFEEKRFHLPWLASLICFSTAVQPPSGRVRVNPWAFWLIYFSVSLSIFISKLLSMPTG